MNSAKVMSKNLVYLARGSIALLVPVIILLTILGYYAFDKDFYMKEYKKYDIVEVTGMNEENLQRVTEKMIKYLKGDEDDLNMKAMIHGEVREVFGQREKQHMVDVKKLFQKGQQIRNFGILVVLLSMMVIYRKSSDFSKDIFSSLLHSSIFALGAIGLLFILINIDFNKYFTYFHEIFFTNDLWLLDPNKEVLIQMLPLEFFTDITTSVLLWFVSIMTTIGALSYGMIRKINRSS